MDYPYVPVVRSASLAGYVDLAQSLGLDARALLRKAGLSPRALDDPETPLSAAELHELLRKLGIRARQLLRTGEDEYKALGLNDPELTDEQLIAAMVSLGQSLSLEIVVEGVEKPGNLGAILRSAAHFGVAGLLLPKDSSLALSGAAARVAEGGAEVVPLVRLGRADNSLAQLTSAGFVAAATVVRGGETLHAVALPERLLLVMGAEQTGVDPFLADAATLRLAIPGTGAVESLNVASATSVFLAEWWRQQRA